MFLQVLCPSAVKTRRKCCHHRIPPNLLPPWLQSVIRRYFANKNWKYCQKSKWALVLLEIFNFVKTRHLFCFTPSVLPFPHPSIHPSEAPAPRCAQGETSQGCTHGHRRDDVGLQVAYIVVITTHCCIEKTRGAATSPEIDHPHFFSGVQAGQFPDFETESDGLETAPQLKVFLQLQ